MEEKYRGKKMQSNCHILNFRGIDLVPPNLNWLQIAVTFLLELDRLKHLHISRSNFAHTKQKTKISISLLPKLPIEDTTLEY